MTHPSEANRITIEQANELLGVASEFIDSTSRMTREQLLGSYTMRPFNDAESQEELDFRIRETMESNAELLSETLRTISQVEDHRLVAQDPSLNATGVVVGFGLCTETGEYQLQVMPEDTSPSRLPTAWPLLSGSQLHLK